MEEISHAFDGGIYAELIQNRGFEEGIVPPGMKLIEQEDGGFRMELKSLPPGVPEDKWPMPWPWNGNCLWDPARKTIGWSLRDRHGGIINRMNLTKANPMNKASTYSLELAVGDKESDDQVSVINSGYWGISVKKGTSYRLNFFLRSGTFQGRMTAELEGQDGSRLAVHTFDPVKPGTEWRKFSSTLEAAGSDAKAKFVLTFEGKGTLQLDWVSLFPPTYKNRPNGLRQDLAKYLEELKPDFVRYPGGCYVEGFSWESAPDWRKMVCPPQERPGMWGYWQYRSTDGFGYHEFLQFCEDVGADAMYVVFAGMTVHPENNWPLDQIDPVIQQTLDAIEYALGPVSSEWGAVRAGMGHPKPFPLKYIEIGNEHPPAIYGDYYRKFRTAIKEKYPDITVIMSMYWSGLNQGAIERAGDEKIDIVDEHAYRDADWIRSNFDYFDKYPRKPWQVYVGEYASHSATGNWRSAISDSVFLMMMERNGDLVKMASYAPLFCNVNQKSWGVNLIEFDSARSFAHASYYVQKIFNEYRPDVNLEITTEVRPKPDPQKPLMGGKFGLGSWSTATEFKDLRIYDRNGDLIYRDDFDTLENWQTPGIGHWTVQEGLLRQTDLHSSPAMLLLKEPQLDIAKVTVKARKTDGSEGFLMFFNADGIDRFLFCNYGAAGNTFHAIQSRGTPENCSFSTGKTTQGAIAQGQWYDISLDLQRHQAAMYLDGEVVSTASTRQLDSLFTAAGYDRADREVIIKAANYYAAPVRTTIHLNGAEKVGETGRMIMMQSSGLQDRNTLDNPRAIIPQERKLSNIAEKFEVVLEPYSVNLLCVPVTK